MPEQVKIQTLRDHTTGDAVAPRTVLSAISGEGTTGQLVGFADDNVVGVVVPDEKPTEGSNKPLTSGTIFNEISKLATKDDLANIKPQAELPDNLVISKEETELPPVELGINADSLQGFNADYFASKDYITASNFATKEELSDYLPASEKDNLATKEQLDSKASKPIILQVTIPTEGWSGEGTKTITIPVEGITGEDSPIIDVVLNGSGEEKIAVLGAWAFIIDITTNEGSITVETMDIPEVEIPINMMVVR